MDPLLAVAMFVIAFLLVMIGGAFGVHNDDQKKIYELTKENEDLKTALRLSKETAVSTQDLLEEKQEEVAIGEHLQTKLKKELTQTKAYLTMLLEEVKEFSQRVTESYGDKDGQA